MSDITLVPTLLRGNAYRNSLIELRMGSHAGAWQPVDIGWAWGLCPPLRILLTGKTLKFNLCGFNSPQLVANGQVGLHKR